MVYGVPTLCEEYARHNIRFLSVPVAGASSLTAISIAWGRAWPKQGGRLSKTKPYGSVGGVSRKFGQRLPRRSVEARGTVL